MADASDVTPVTGQTVFWALLAVALTAATQRSYTSEEADPALKTTDLPIVAYRSSPIVCFWDTFHEICDIIRYYGTRKARLGQRGETQSSDTDGQSHDETENEASSPDAAVVSLKVVLFILGALPQVIKLFACQGIPIVQALAAVYLVSIVVHAAHYVTVTTSRTAAGHKMIFIADGDDLGTASRILHNLLYTLVWPKIAVASLFWLRHTHEVLLYLTVVTSVLINSASLCLLAFDIILVFVVGPRIPDWLTVTVQVSMSLGEVFRSATTKDDKQAAINEVDPFGTGSAVDRLRACSTLYVAYTAAVLLPAVTCAVVIAGVFWIADTLLPVHTLDASPGLRDVDVTSASDEPSASDKLATQLRIHFAEHLRTSQQPGTSDESRTVDEQAEEMTRDFMELLHSSQQPSVPALKPEPTAKTWRQYGATLMAGQSIVLERALTPFYIADRATKWMLAFKPAVRYTAFLLMNILTAAFYFTIVFDGTGTVNPGWTGVFG